MTHCKRFRHSTYVSHKQEFDEMNDFLKRLNKEDIIAINTIKVGDTSAMTYIYYDPERFMNNGAFQSI